MRTVRAVGFGLVLLAGGAVSARAQNAGGINYAELFQQLDANGDLVIERGEVPESGRPAFEVLLKNADTNQDGKLDREEYRDMLLSLREAVGSVKTKFAEIDKNGDGKISKDEFTGPEALFGRIDTDGDGVITLEEAQKFQPGPGAGAGAGANAAFLARLRAMDKDGDGKITREEFTGQPAVFERLDANKDGVLTRDEIPGGAAAGAAAPNRALMLQRLRAMDTNNDGTISRDEFTGPAAVFDRLDANKDGALTPEELRQARPDPGKAARPQPNP
jgi:Ca2+-binding EF-hand superfamily protein